MPTEIDDLVQRLQDISSHLDAMEGSNPERPGLLAERARLRSRARTLGDAMRHPLSIATEIEMLEKRLDEIESTFIGKGNAEKYHKRGFADPGAYSATINRKLLENHTDEIQRIRERLVSLREHASGGDEG